MLAVFPADRLMPDLLDEIAAWRGCALAKKWVGSESAWRAVNRRECEIVYDVEPTP